MEMCYDGIMVMPNSAVLMDPEEMTYVDGGSSQTLNETTGKIRSRLDVIINGAIVGNAAAVAAGAAVGNILGAVIGYLAGSAYFTPMINYGRAAHNKVEGFIAKYGTNKACSMTSTWSTIFLTGITVSV